MCHAPCAEKASVVKAIPQIFVVIVMLTGGQLLFRQAAVSTPPLHSLAAVARLLLNPAFLLAMVIYGAATLLWVRVLQKMPLWQAYPFMALGFVVVPVVALLTSRGTVSVRFALGLVLVVSGLILIGGRS